MFQDIFSDNPYSYKENILLSYRETFFHIISFNKTFNSLRKFQILFFFDYFWKDHLHSIAPIVLFFLTLFSP